MFDLVFNGFAAFQQMGMLLAGLMCLGIGGLIIGNCLYWRQRAEHVEGTIIGVKQDGVFYYPVYRYTLPSTGEEVEATSDSGTSSSAGMDTGKTLQLLVFADDPKKARPAGGVLFYVIGLVFAIPGILFPYIALTTFPVNKFTLVALVGFSAYAAVKIHGKILPKGKRLSMDAFRAKAQSRLGNLPVQQIEALNATPDGQARIAQLHKNQRVATPILIVLGLALLAGGGYLAQKMQHLLAEGLRAPGQVTSIESSNDSDNTTIYYARVTYRDASGVEHNFRDSSGASRPFYSTGDSVNVVYMADDPDKAVAIERGWKNWIPSGALMGFGLLLLLCGLSMLKAKEKAL